jgi:hypothetical protein
MSKRAIMAIAMLIAIPGIGAAQRRPEAFGVVVGAGQPESVRTANYTAMKACLESAMAAKVAVLLPAATIEIDVPNLGSSASSTLKIKRDLQIIGADRRLSKLKFGPESPAYDYSAFYAGPNTVVSFKNCIIEGPSDPGPKGKFNRLTYAILQSGMSYTASGGKVYDTPGELRLENVGIAGKWYTSIQGAHGDVPLVLINCDITGYTQCVTWSASFNFGKRLYAQNTYFHDAGLPGKGHLIYLSPSVSFEIDRCRFAGNYRYAIHHYGSANLTPKFARLSNSTFEASCADGIETTNTGLTEISNCTFNNTRRGVALKGNTNIQDSTFNSSTGVTTYDNHASVQVNISRCKFNSVAVAVLTSIWPDCVWNISDCDFTGQGTDSIGIANGALHTQINVNKCRFNGDWKRGLVAAAGTYSVSDCMFEGSYSEAAVVYDDTEGDVAQLIVNNCSFAATGHSIWARNGASGKLSGADNFFTASQPLAKPGMYQRLQLRKGKSPTKLASAELLRPNFNYDSYRVTGTARISSIKLGGSDEVTQMCAGQLRLVADGAWSLGDGGNIKPLASGARHVGEVVTLAHDPLTGFWVEIKDEMGHKL